MILHDTASCGGHDKNKHNKIVPILQKKRFGAKVSMYLLWIWTRNSNKINIDTCITYRHSNIPHDGGRLQKIDTCQSSSRKMKHVTQRKRKQMWNRGDYFFLGGGRWQLGMANRLPLKKGKEKYSFIFFLTTFQGTWWQVLEGLWTWALTYMHMVGIHEHIWTYGGMDTWGLGSSRILIYMYRCNELERRGWKIVVYLWFNR